MILGEWLMVSSVVLWAILSRCTGKVRVVEKKKKKKIAVKVGKVMHLAF